MFSEMVSGIVLIVVGEALAGASTAAPMAAAAARIEVNRISSISLEG